MRFKLRPTLATLVVAGSIGALACPAIAAPPWSTPVPVPGERYQPLSLAFASNGTGVLAAPAVVPFDPERRFEPFRLATLTATGTIEDRGRLPGGGLATAPLTYGRDRVALVRSRVVRRSRRLAQARVRLSASFGTTRQPGSGSQQTLADLVAGPDARPEVDAAASAAGDIAVAWIDSSTTEEPPYRRSRLQLAIRRPGGRFAEPVALRTGVFLDDVRVVWGEGGDLLVAYTRSVAGRRRPGGARAFVEARVLRAGRSLGSVERVGPSRGRDALDAAVAPGGRMVIAWGTLDPGEEVNEPYEIRTAIRPAGARSFRAPQLLDDGGGADRPGGSFGDVRVGMARDGSATVAYTARRPVGRTDFAYPVLAATAGRTGRFGPPQQLAPEGALSGLAVRPDGSAVAVWSLLGDEVATPDYGIRAAVRPANSSAFGAPEVVTDTERSGGAQLALGPDGAPVVAFTTYEPASGITRFRASIVRRPAP